jgi:hypothetical protein
VETTLEGLFREALRAAVSDRLSEVWVLKSHEGNTVVS